MNCKNCKHFDQILTQRADFDETTGSMKVTSVATGFGSCSIWVRGMTYRMEDLSSDGVLVPVPEPDCSVVIGEMFGCVHFSSSPGE